MQLEHGEMRGIQLILVTLTIMATRIFIRDPSMESILNKNMLYRVYLESSVETKEP